MSGSWERCGALGGRNKAGYHYTCNKKAGHLDGPKQADQEHADTKNMPVVRWKDK